MGKESGRRYCTANRGFHHSAAAAKRCPYHRAVLAATPPTPGLSARAPQYPPLNTPIVVDNRNSEGLGDVIHFLDEYVHRDDGPAKIHYSGDTITESWLRFGAPYREDDLPNKVMYLCEEDGSRGPVDSEIWLSPERGFHRVGAPAAIHHGGRLGGMRWYVNGKRHRDDGPSYVSKADEVPVQYHLDGEAVSEETVRARFLSRFGIHEDNVAAQELLDPPMEGPMRTFRDPDPALVELALRMHANP